MRKIFLLFVFTNFCFSQTNENKYSDNLNYNNLIEIGKKISEPMERYNFYKHLFLVSKLNEFRESEKEDSTITDKKYSDDFIYSILKNYVHNEPSFNILSKDLDKKMEYEELTLREKIKKLDSSYVSSHENEYSHELNNLFYSPFCHKLIEKIENNFIYVYGDCGSDMSRQSETLFIKQGDIIDTGWGVNKLSNSNFKKLEKLIRNKFKNYSHFYSRSGAEIQILKNGNFKIKTSALKEDEPGMYHGSISISYETKDLKSFIPESLKIEEEKSLYEAE